MNPATFDTTSRLAAATLSRRGSLLALGGAALAAITGGTTAEARKKNKNGKDKRNADKRCQRQVAACEALFAEACTGNRQCGATFLPCCAPLARCDAAASLACFRTGWTEGPE